MGITDFCRHFLSIAATILVLTACSSSASSKHSASAAGRAAGSSESAFAHSPVPAPVAPSPVLSVNPKEMALEGAAMHFGDACKEDSAGYGPPDKTIIADCSEAIKATRNIEYEAKSSGHSQADLDATSFIIAMELFSRGSAYVHRGNFSDAKNDYDESQTRANQILKDHLLVSSDMQGVRILLRTDAEMQKQLSETH